MNERRTARRMKSFLRGFVYVDKDRGACSCLIRDMNEQGARIIFSEAITLPSIISLHIPQKDQTLRARVSWRRNDEIGLAFTEVEQRVPDASPTAIEIVQRVALLEAEISSLRSMLKRMKAETAGDYDEAVA